MSATRLKDKNYSNDRHRIKNQDISFLSNNIRIVSWYFYAAAAVIILVVDQSSLQKNNTQKIKKMLLQLEADLWR